MSAEVTGTVRVRLEDVSRADAPARVVAEAVVREARLAAPVPFALRAPAVDERARYVVRAHVDVDGDGAVGLGDYVSTQSTPVLTHGAPRRVEVIARRVE